MELIGTVSRLQIQESSLKVGDKPRRYDPAPLRPVSSLIVTPGGVVASDIDGTPLIDVHHQDHPASKNREGENGISLGFTGHYGAMRDRFGHHLVDGIAGENILIEANRQFAAEELARGVVIVGADGRHLPLTDVIVAAPCVEFTRFAMRFPDNARPDATVTTALQFLHNGMRGFYARLEAETVEIQVGDRVYIS